MSPAAGWSRLLGAAGTVGCSTGSGLVACATIPGKLLGLDPDALQALRMEHMALLPLR